MDKRNSFIHMEKCVDLEKHMTNILHTHIYIYYRKKELLSISGNFSNTAVLFKGLGYLKDRINRISSIE